MRAFARGAALVAAAVSAGAALGIGFFVKGGIWRPRRPTARGHGLLGLAAVALAVAVVAVGPPPRAEPEGGVSFGVLAMAFLIPAAGLGIVGDRTASRHAGRRGFVLSAHALFAVFGSALAIAAAVTAGHRADPERRPRDGLRPAATRPQAFRRHAWNGRLA